MSKQAFSKEEAAALYRMATGSDFAPSQEAVEAGAIPHQYQDAVNRLAELAGPPEPAPAEEKKSGPPRGTRSTAS